LLELPLDDAAGALDFSAAGFFAAAAILAASTLFLFLINSEIGRSSSLSDIAKTRGM